MRVEQLYADCQRLVDTLNAQYLISDAAFANDLARKALAVAAASAFESDITALLESFADQVTSGNDYCSSLIRTRIVARQYHQLFDWKTTSAGGFFANFGKEARKFYDDSVRADALLGQAVRDFLDLGNLRNEIVHIDFSTYAMNKTIQDIITQYRSARRFLNFLEKFLLLAVTGSLLGVPNA